MGKNNQLASKPIGKSDDSAKEFIIRALKGDKTYGFDLDSVYKVYDKKKECYTYYIFEYLKCEHKRQTPHTSHPRFYPYNWKKFLSLFEIAKNLKGKLILVNYSDGYKVVKNQDGTTTAIPLGDTNKIKELCNQVRLFEVVDIKLDLIHNWLAVHPNMRPKHLDYLVFKNIENITFDEFSKRLRKLNQMSGKDKD